MALDRSARPLKFMQRMRYVRLNMSHATRLEASKLPGTRQNRRTGIKARRPRTATAAKLRTSAKRSRNGTRLADHPSAKCSGKQDSYIDTCADRCVPENMEPPRGGQVCSNGRQALLSQDTCYE